MKPPMWWAYYAQRNSAAKRGIPFLLTYDEWFEIWSSSGRLTERGKRRDQYCMARKGNVGPYAINNVIIITNAENTRQLAKRLLATGTHPLTQTSSREERIMWARRAGRKSGEAWGKMTPEQRHKLGSKRSKKGWVGDVPGS